MVYLTRIPLKRTNSQPYSHKDIEAYTYALLHLLGILVNTVPVGARSVSAIFSCSLYIAKVSKKLVSAALSASSVASETRPSFLIVSNKLE